MPLFNPAASGSSIGDLDTVIEKANTDSVTNAGLTADSELVTALAANTVYLVELGIAYDSNNISTGITWRLTGPAADHANLIIGNYTMLVDAANAVESQGLLGSSTTVWGSKAAGVPNTGLKCPLYIRVMWPVAGAGGDLTFLSGNTNASSGRTTRTLAGSFMRVRKLG